MILISLIHKPKSLWKKDKTGNFNVFSFLFQWRVEINLLEFIFFEAKVAHLNKLLFYVIVIFFFRYKGKHTKRYIIYYSGNENRQIQMLPTQTLFSSDVGSRGIGNSDWFGVLVFRWHWHNDWHVRSYLSTPTSARIQTHPYIHIHMYTFNKYVQAYTYTCVCGHIYMKRICIQK